MPPWHFPAASVESAPMLAGPVDMPGLRVEKIVFFKKTFLGFAEKIVYFSSRESLPILLVTCFGDR